MTQFTVLVTDDDQDIRDGIEIYLKNEGYRARVRQLERGHGPPVRRCSHQTRGLYAAGGHHRQRRHDAEYGWNSSDV